MGEVQTLSYVTNLNSLKEIEKIRKILDEEKDVDYWYLDITSPDNKLMIMGRHLESVISELRKLGYISTAG